VPITKAVIPAAGLGTRFLPITKASPKEMLPLIDKPLIQYSVEEAIQAGLKNIIIVTGKGKRAIEDYFDYSFELEHYLRERKKLDQLSQIKEVSELAEFIYVRQKHALGLGDAIHLTENVICNENFAVFLPDSVFIDSPKPCITQLMEVHDKYNASVVALMKVKPAEYKRFGMVKVEQIDERTYKILGLVEKPAETTQSPSDLAVAERYILTPHIFKELKRTKPGVNQEIQITDAFNHLLKSQPMYGYRFEGRRLDIGDKLGFIISTIQMALSRPDLKKEVRDYLDSLHVQKD
jgi:UTP--glucose-1-phosphate uridylyltransferase